MDQNTPTVKKQLSSSLRERLKKCGRYHASPKSDCSSGTSTANGQQPLKSSISPSNDKVAHAEERTSSLFISPLSRKRSSAPDLDENVNSKRVHSDIGLDRNKGDKENTKQEPADSEVKECTESRFLTLNDSDQPVEVNKTPLTSRSRSRNNTLKTNRLTFQNRADGCDSSDSKIKDLSSDSSRMSSKEATENYVEVKGERPDINSGTVKHRSTVPLTHSELLREIADKEEKLRKLNMVKTYRTKNDLTELQALIDKWREVSQQALQDLHSEMPDPKPTLAQLVDHLGIEHELLNFDAEEETFE